MGIVESYTDGLRYMIENEKVFNRQASRGELGVRVQAKGNHSDIIGSSAVASVMTREVLVACDFLGDVLESVDRYEKFKSLLLDCLKSQLIMDNLSILWCDIDLAS